MDSRRDQARSDLTTRRCRRCATRSCCRSSTRPRHRPRSAAGPRAAAARLRAARLLRHRRGHHAAGARCTAGAREARRDPARQEHARAAALRFAIEAGMRAAAAPVVLVMMADLSDDLRPGREMISLIEEGADVVCASRYVRGGKQVGGPLVKKTLSAPRGALAPLPGGPADPRSDEQLQGLSQVVPRQDADRERRGLLARPRAHREGPLRWRPRRRGALGLVRPHQRRESVPAAQVASPVPALVRMGVP